MGQWDETEIGETEDLLIQLLSSWAFDVLWMSNISLMIFNVFSYVVDASNREYIGEEIGHLMTF